MIIKTKGKERISYDTVEEAAKAAGKGKLMLADLIKRGRLLDGWKYVEEKTSPAAVKKDPIQAMPWGENIVEYIEHPILDAPAPVGTLTKADIDNLVEHMNNSKPAHYKDPIAEAQLNAAIKEEFGNQLATDMQKVKDFLTIPQDFLLTNTQKLINRRKKK